MWVKLRDWKRRSAPLCEICEIKGRITAGAEVHHLISFMTATDLVERDRLAYDPDNLITICEGCHHEIHHGRLKGCTTKKQISDRLESL